MIHLAFFKETSKITKIDSILRFDWEMQDINSSETKSIC